MNKKDFKNEHVNEGKNLFDLKNEDYIKINDNNCFIYGEKNESFNEDILLKQKDENGQNYSNKHKPSIDIEKNLHEFLNDDLIKALNNDLMDPDDNCENSDSNSTNAYITGSSDFNSKSNSPEINIKHSKNQNDINMNLNTNNYWNEKETTDLNYVNKNIPVNKDNINNNENNEQNINEENINIKEQIKLKIDPLLAPVFIPKKFKNFIDEDKQNEEKKINNKDKHKKKEKKNNPFKNKFDDDVEPTIMLTMTNIEERTKLPLEIRVGDWICLYCNNLNFSFRIKCNRCGLLRKSSTYLLKKKYFNNKFKFMSNYYNEGYKIDYNNNMNYDLNCDSNDYNNRI